MNVNEGTNGSARRPAPAIRKTKMKKAITTALLATLLASTAVQAFAQDAPRGRAGERREHSQGSPERSNRPQPAQETQSAPPPPPQRSSEPHRAGRAGIIDRDAPRYAPRPAPAPQAPPAPQARPAPRPGDNDRYGGGHDWNDRNRGGSDWNRRWDDDRRRNDNGWNDNRRWNDDRRWNDGYRGGGYNRPNYDRRYYPPVYRIPHRYNVAPYRRPPGWYSFSWSFGDTLPHAWYGPNYWINDWWSYGLPVPPIGYEWVRVGDDALLIDEYTGRVVQVVYNLFW